MSLHVCGFTIFDLTFFIIINMSLLLLPFYVVFNDFSVVFLSLYFTSECFLSGFVCIGILNNFNIL